MLSLDQEPVGAASMTHTTIASVLGELTVPIYQGGGEYSAIRQSKETLGQQRQNLDVNRDQARAAIRRIRERAEKLKLGPFEWAEWKAFRDEGRP